MRNKLITPNNTISDVALEFSLTFSSKLILKIPGLNKTAGS